MVGPVLAQSVTGGLLVLVGTLVGALIGSGSTYVLARSKRRDEARAFARLVEDELHSAADVVDEWLAAFPPKKQPETAALQDAAWNEGRTVLAYWLQRSRWDTVREGYRELGRLRRSLEDGRLLEAKEIETARNRINDARDTLASQSIGGKGGV